MGEKPVGRCCLPTAEFCRDAWHAVRCPRPIGHSFVSATLPHPTFATPIRRQREGRDRRLHDTSSVVSPAHPTEWTTAAGHIRILPTPTPTRGGRKYLALRSDV